MIRAMATVTGAVLGGMVGASTMLLVLAGHYVLAASVLAGAFGAYWLFSRWYLSDRALSAAIRREKRKEEQWDA